MPGGQPKGSIWIYIGIGGAVLIAAVVMIVVLRKRAIRRKELSLDE
jgi:flagellar basal body-associated protein FliL